VSDHRNVLGTAYYLGAVALGVVGVSLMFTGHDYQPYLGLSTVLLCGALLFGPRVKRLRKHP
jgi:hypothetical protein